MQQLYEINEYKTEFDAYFAVNSISIFGNVWNFH